MLHDFEQHLTQALNAAQRKIARDLESLEKLSTQAHRRTAAQIEDQAERIREAMSDLDASRTEWRTVTWKTMLPTYLAGVLLTLGKGDTGWIITAPWPVITGQRPKVTGFCALAPRCQDRRGRLVHEELG